MFELLSASWQLSEGLWRSGTRTKGGGAVQSPDRRGVGFAHLSHIVDQTGFHELDAGEDVEFEWSDNFSQDGCQYRVKWVRRLSPSETAG